MIQKKPGYIIPLTLLLVTLFMFIVTYLSSKGAIYSALTKTMEQREKARQLAYGGIQLAISQLAHASDTEKKETPLPTPMGKQQPVPVEEGSEAKQLIKVIMPLLGVPQEFKLTRAVDGIDATISLTLGSEDGKININRVYDFKNHKFIGEGQPRGDMKKVMEQFFVRLKEQTGADLFAEFASFLKKRDYPLNDVTELLAVKGFDYFKNKLFYTPKDLNKRSVYLTDLFTTWSANQQLEPWLLSLSLQRVWGLKKPETVTDDLLKSFKQTRTFPTDAHAFFKAVYGADYASVSAFESLLNPRFTADTFNVLSTATVGTATVRFFAILEREKISSDKAAGFTVTLLKVYSL